MQSHNTPVRRESTSQTRRRTLRTIGGVLLSAGAIGTAGAHNHATEIDGPTVINEPGHYELVDNIVATSSGFVIKIVANDVTLEGNGYTIDGNGDSEGVEINGVSDATIQNINIRNLDFVGIRVRNSTALTVQDLTITYPEAYGIRADNTDSSLVERVDAMAGFRAFEVEGNDNTFVDNDTSSGEGNISISGSGNEVRGTNDSSMYGISVQGDNNHVHQNTTNWFGAPASINIQGDRNRVHDNSLLEGYGSLSINGTDNVVTRNLAEDRDYGIRVWDDNNTIVNNEARECIIGIRLTGDHNRVIRNDVRDNYEAGILDEGENNLLRANITD